MAVNKVKITNDVELKDRLVAINRVTKVTKGGRTFSFSAIVVVGNEDGIIGWGLGKAGEVTAAIAKGVEAAKKNLIRVPVLKGTVPHEQAAKVGELIAKKAQEAGITTVVFDRNGYLYHGRIKEVADAARNGGLKF